MENLSINDKITWIRFKLEIIKDIMNGMTADQKQIIFNSLMEDIFGSKIAMQLAQYDISNIDLSEKQEIEKENDEIINVDDTLQEVEDNSEFKIC